MLPPRTAITFAGGGMPPVCTNLVRYFEEPGLFKPTRDKGVIARTWDAIRTLFSSALILVTGIINRRSFYGCARVLRRSYSLCFAWFFYMITFRTKDFMELTRLEEERKKARDERAGKAFNGIFSFIKWWNGK
jgi:hypothetical protein